MENYNGTFLKINNTWDGVFYLTTAHFDKKPLSRTNIAHITFHQHNQTFH